MDEVPKEHLEILRAAHALFAGVAREDTIYRTIVCAAWAGNDPKFRRMRDATLAAGEGSEQWDLLCHDFDNAFRGSLEPWRVQNDVLLVRRPPLDVLAVGPDDEGLFREVHIQVRDRSATAEDVANYYEKCLSTYGLSHVAGRGVFAYYVAENSLLMLTRPEQEESFHPELKYLVRSQAKQGKFPDPRDVGEFYEMLRAKGYPKGRRGGSSPEPQQ